MTQVSPLDAMPSLTDIDRLVHESSPSWPTTLHIIPIPGYRTGLMYENQAGQSKPNTASASWNADLASWYSVEKQAGQVIMETGYVEEGSAAVLLEKSGRVETCVIHIDPEVRHWVVETRPRYLHHPRGFGRHVPLEGASEVLLARNIRDPVFGKLPFADGAGSHLLGVAFVDLVLLDRLLELGGLIAFDDDTNLASYRLFFLVTDNLAGSYTFRLAVCMKNNDDERELVGFRPIWISPDTDTSPHDGFPRANVIPTLSLAEDVTAAASSTTVWPSSKKDAT